MYVYRVFILRCAQPSIEILPNSRFKLRSHLMVGSFWNQPGHECLLTIKIFKNYIYFICFERVLCALVEPIDMFFFPTAQTDLWLKWLALKLLLFDSSMRDSEANFWLPNELLCCWEVKCSFSELDSVIIEFSLKKSLRAETMLLFSLAATLSSESKQLL